jgi:DNA-binding NarL/FixJ family response regulator
MVGTAQTGRQVLEQAEKLRPDIVLLDASMPGMSGFEAARQLKHRSPTVRIIFLTMLTEAVAVG